MQSPVASWSLSALPIAAVATVFIACAGGQEGAPSPVVATSAASARPATHAAPPASSQPAATGPIDRDKIAVLPWEDDQLFRDERRALRVDLARALAARLPNDEIVALGDVDAKVRPVSKSGARCAFDGAPPSRRTDREGWLATGVSQVVGTDESPEQLWVDLSRAGTSTTALAATWSWHGDRMAAYRSAFVSLAPGGPTNVLGGLAYDIMSSPGAIAFDPIRLCEGAAFEACSRNTKAFADRAKDFAACFAGADEERRDLVFDEKRCELQNVDDPSETERGRESCLCAALGKSAGVSAGKGRRELAVQFEAPDIKNKPRPALSVVSVSGDLHTESGMRSQATTSAGKTTYTSTARLEIDGLDALAAPLSRCGLAPGSFVVAELTVSDAGAVQKTQLVTKAKNAREATCLEHAFSTGAFDCTSDGKPATVRIAATFP